MNEMKWSCRWLVVVSEYWVILLAVSLPLQGPDLPRDCSLPGTLHTTTHSIHVLQAFKEVNEDNSRAVDTRASRSDQARKSRWTKPEFESNFPWPKDTKNTATISTNERCILRPLQRDCQIIGRRTERCMDRARGPV